MEKKDGGACFLYLAVLSSLIADVLETGS